MRKQGMLPNVIHWSIVLHIWCTSEEVDKEEVVPRLFAEMVDKDGVSPNAVTYTSLLSLWSKSTNRSVALDNVQRIYQRLLVDLPPLDGKSFQLLVNALLRHLDSPATALLATLARQQEEGATKVSALLATFDRYFFTLRVHLYRIENDSSSSTSTAVTLLPRLQQTLRHILPLFLRLIRSDARYSHMLPRLVATLRHSLTAESRASSQRRYWEKIDRALIRIEDNLRAIISSSRLGVGV
eukprot:gene11191-12479_t